MNGVNLSGYFPMAVDKFARFEKLFMEKIELALLENHNGYRHHSRKANLVCDDTNSGSIS
jgi:hypothetical protein